MNMGSNGLLIILSLVAFVSVQAADYATVEIPVGVKSASNVISVKWVGISRTLPPVLPPDSGSIYFSRYPGGSKIANSPDSVKVPYYDTTKNALIDNIYYPG